MSRRFSSIAVSLGVLLIAGGVYAEPARGPVEKRLDLERLTDGQNAKKKPKKKDVEAEEAAEEEEASEKKKSKKGKKAKKDVEEAEEEEEEKPKKKKGKKAKKEAVEEEPEPEEKPKKKGKKGKKEEPPPEEEPVDLKDTESPTAEPEEELPAEPLEEEPPAEEASDESKESAKAEESASVSTADLAGKLVLGVRLGFGFPIGKTTGEDSFKFSNMVPIWLDLGYKFTPNLMVGLYGHYAFAGISDCYSNAECSAYVWRFGAQVQYEFSPEGTIDPWVGLGIGYEISGGKITVTADGESLESTFQLKGFEFANLQVGADYKVSPTVGVGPFVSFSLGRYASGEQTRPGLPTESGGVENKTMHEWLVLGVRGSFLL
jgi:outer membrane protein W